MLAPNRIPCVSHTGAQYTDNAQNTHFYFKQSQQHLKPRQRNVSILASFRRVSLPVSGRTSQEEGSLEKRTMTFLKSMVPSTTCRVGSPCQRVTLRAPKRIVGL
eukprot:7376725-Prymnesium_polylepis.3